MKKIFGEFSLPAFCCGYAIGFAGKLRCVIDNASIHKNRKSRGNIMKAFAKLGVLVAAAGFATAASAALVNAPVPVNAYITYGGLNWAWAAPASAKRARPVAWAMCVSFMVCLRCGWCEK